MLIEVFFVDAYLDKSGSLLEIDDSGWNDYKQDIYKFCGETLAKCYSLQDMTSSFERYLARHNIEHRWLHDDAQFIVFAESRRPPKCWAVQYSGWRRDLKDFFKDPNTARIWHCEKEVKDFLEYYDNPSVNVFADKILDAAYNIDDSGVRWGLGFDQEDLMLHSIYCGKENKEENENG